MFDPARIGRSIRVIRIRLGWRQQDLADRAKVSRSFVSKVELGKATTADLGKLQAICAALGADLDVRVRWRGEGVDRLLDEAHASLVDRVTAILHAAGWEVGIEVTFNDFGDRGSIDVLAWHQGRRALLVIEVKSVVPDAQGTLMPLDRKSRVAPKLARARGWQPATPSRLLIIGENTTNRDRVQRLGELFDAALPARGRTVRRWLADPAGTIAGLWFLRDSTPGGARRATTWRTRVNRPRGRPAVAG